MILSSQFKDKTILLIDQNTKKNNDRTWCFWDKTSLFDDIVSKKWETLAFITPSKIQKWNINPYNYKMIKGIDFYDFIFDIINKQSNITFLKEKVIGFEDLGNQCLVTTEKNSYSSTLVFNSIFKPKILASQNKYPLLQQHFLGWFIKAKESIFNSQCATFMDFSVQQKENTRFMYVLPFSDSEALIEYTLFSKDLLAKQEYEEEVRNYIAKMGITDYEIVEKEQGNIPMTSFPFWKQNTKNIIHIGSAGGWTKASTGYTFKKSYKQAKTLVAFILKSKGNLNFKNYAKKNKFWYYDILFIDVLYQNNALGKFLFTALFKKKNPVKIFKFLDEETALLEDLEVIWKCPKPPFLKAVLTRIIR